MQNPLIDFLNPIISMFYTYLQILLNAWDSFMGILTPYLDMIPIPFEVPWSNVIATFVFLFFLGLIFYAKSDGSDAADVRIPVSVGEDGSTAAPSDSITVFMMEKRNTINSETLKKILEQETIGAISAIELAKKDNQISGSDASRLKKIYERRLENLKVAIQTPEISTEEDKLEGELDQLKEQAKQREDEILELQDRLKKVKPSTPTPDKNMQFDNLVESGTGAETEPVAVLPKTTLPTTTPVQESSSEEPSINADSDMFQDTSGEELIGEMLDAIQNITKEFETTD